MNKIIATVLSAALVAAPAMSCAAEQDSGFFANINAGLSSNRLSVDFEEGAKFDRQDSTYALRSGYRWGSAMNYGVEVGYADLGSAEAYRSYPNSFYGLTQKTAGILVGGNLQYDFNGSNWFTGIRGGWFQADNELIARSGRSAETAQVQGRLKTDHSGYYAGANFGYKVTDGLRVGLAYDSYGSELEIGDYKDTYRVETYSGFFEYVF